MSTQIADNPFVFDTFGTTELHLYIFKINCALSVFNGFTDAIQSIVQQDQEQ